MYVIPLLLAILVAIVSVAFSPIFGLIIAGILFLLFLGYVGLRPRADEAGATKARPAEKGSGEPAAVPRDS